MSPARPGEIKSRFPASPPADGGHLPEALAALERDVLPGITHWNHPALLRLLPVQHHVCVGPGRYPRVRARRPGHELADVARRHRDRGNGHRLAPPDGRTVARLVGRHSRHGQHSDALRAAVRAREGVGIQPARRAACRRVLRRSSLRIRGGAQLDRQGGAPGGLRPRRTCGSSPPTPSTPSTSSRLRQAMETDRAGRAAVRRRSWRRSGPRARRRSILCRGSQRSPSSTAPGCMSTRPWLGRRWSSRSAGGCGTGVEHADSLVFNPHKWMGVGFDFSAYYVRDPEHLVRVMSTNPSYLQDGPGWRGQEFPRLAHPAWPALPRAQALVSAARCRCRGSPGAAPAGPRERALARRADRPGRGLGAGRARPVADRVLSPRAT